MSYSMGGSCGTKLVTIFGFWALFAIQTKAESHSCPLPLGSAPCQIDAKAGDVIDLSCTYTSTNGANLPGKMNPSSCPGEFVSWSGKLINIENNYKNFLVVVDNVDGNVDKKRLEVKSDFTDKITMMCSCQQGPATADNQIPDSYTIIMNINGGSAAYDLYMAVAPLDSGIEDFKTLFQRDT